MTLATVIRDVYRTDERREMRQALRTLFAQGGHDWHPSGLYCFWDPDSRDVLYLGLAGNLERRFSQHNRLAGTTERGNKSVKINEWFQSHERLGYSVVVQSAAVVLLDGLEDLGLDDASGIIVSGEGQLIESFCQRFGAIPPWNAIGGSTAGARFAAEGAAAYFSLMTGDRDSLFVARRTMRQLAAEPESVDHEMTLHGGRMHALHENGWAGVGANDTDVRRALRDLAANPSLQGLFHDEPARQLALHRSGYFRLPAPHPEIR
jgi:hypothetical protein